MPRSRIGPLALEAPLGGRASNVFRALHIEQKIQLAVRVFAVPMGMTPESKKEFTSELESLKKLKHPGIARCYGGGFDQRDAYLVYELVDGESLEALLARRQRLPWELVLDYGLQLCEAIQLAHDMKWCHGRIRPDKLLITQDGTKIKLSDFRGETTLTMKHGGGAWNQAAYTAPEALDGESSIPADLYSLGAVLYHMLTGHPPFVAKDIGTLRGMITKQSPPPVATIVFDCPVWLSSIVEQLLEKAPEKRLFSATATSMALNEAQRRAMLGTSVVQHATSGFSPIQLKSADRKEAEKVLGYKKKKQRRESDGNEPAFYERPWFLGVCLLGVIGIAIWLMMPLNARQLRDRAEKLLATGEATDWNDARELYLDKIVAQFPKSETAVWAEEQIEEIEMKNAERKMERNIKLHREPSSEGERKYVEANRFERFGDRITALDQYHAIVRLFKDTLDERPFVNMSLRQIAALEKEPQGTEELKLFLNSKLEEARKLSEAGDDRSARTIWESIVRLYSGNEGMKSVVKAAKDGIKSLDKKEDSDADESVGKAE